MWTYSMIFVRVCDITCSLSVIWINLRVCPEIQQGAYNSTMTTACRKWQRLRNTLEHNFDIYIQWNSKNCWGTHLCDTKLKKTDPNVSKKLKQAQTLFSSSGLIITTLTVHPRISCLLISAPCSNSFSQTVTLPSFAAYINGDMRYLGSSQKKELQNIWIDGRGSFTKNILIASLLKQLTYRKHWLWHSSVAAVQHTWKPVLLECVQMLHMLPSAQCTSLH